MADIAIGLGYLSVGAAGRQLLALPGSRTCCYELVGVTGPVQFASDARGDLYHVLTSALGLFTLRRHHLPVPAPGASRGPGSPPADAERIRELLARHGDRDSLGYFALRDDKSVIWSPSGKAASATGWCPA